MTHISYLLVVLSRYLLAFSVISKNNQISNLKNLIKSRRLVDQPQVEQWTEEYISRLSPVYTVPQQGTSEADRIDRLPGQPEADFDHYAGYVTVDAKAERALFYYFAESPHNSSTNPLVLWLNGGPGCSSFGYGAMAELGPFRVNSDGKTLYRNDYAWNNVANVLFLESPVGVGFSYSNRSSDYTTGDKRTSEDSYTFLINWLERYPQYKTRNFYITGESYAGHFVPQLASLILSENKKRNQTIINLKGIAIGNPQIDYRLWYKENFDYLWTHALNSDETNEGINKYCDFDSENYSVKCYEYLTQSDYETGDIDPYNIYAPLCDDSTQPPEPLESVMNYDPCSEGYVATYLNLAEVQEALHARTTSWEHCRNGSEWTDRPITILPIIKQLSEKRIMVWIFSGDLDTVISVTSTRYSVSKMKLPLVTAWQPWYSNKQVGGHVVGYKGVVLTTVRGAGHQVPSYQPESALVMISSFLQGILPPSLKE